MSKLTAVTPIGKAEWFSLTKEDKFGNFTCNLKLEDNPETHKLISKIDELGSGRKPYTKQSDGTFILKLKVKSVGQKKDGTSYQINPPVLYNAMGKKIEGMDLVNLNVGNGSEIRAKIELSAYEFMGQAGVSCKPKSVQIAKLVEFSGGDSDLGFDALELNHIDNGESDSNDYDF